MVPKFVSPVKVSFSLFILLFTKLSLYCDIPTNTFGFRGMYQLKGWTMYGNAMIRNKNIEGQVAATKKTGRNELKAVVTSDKKLIAQVAHNLNENLKAIIQYQCGGIDYKDKCVRGVDEYYYSGRDTGKHSSPSSDKDAWQGARNSGNGARRCDRGGLRCRRRFSPSHSVAPRENVLYGRGEQKDIPRVYRRGERIAEWII